MKGDRENGAPLTRITQSGKEKGSTPLQVLQRMMRGFFDLCCYSFWEKNRCFRQEESEFTEEVSVRISAWAPKIMRPLHNHTDRVYGDDAVHDVYSWYCNIHCSSSCFEIENCKRDNNFRWRNIVWSKDMECLLPFILLFFHLMISTSKTCVSIESLISLGKRGLFSTPHSSLLSPHRILFLQGFFKSSFCSSHDDAAVQNTRSGGEKWRWSDDSRGWTEAQGEENFHVSERRRKMMRREGDKRSRRDGSLHFVIKSSGELGLGEASFVWQLNSSE